MMPLYIAVGLGNPGLKYRNNRHNVGFAVIDRISSIAGFKVKKLKFKSLIGEGLVGDKGLVLVKPQTYMNASGEAVLEVVKWYKPDLGNLILIYDDADLPSGRIRIRPSGSSGSHNGMKSVIYHLGSDMFPRIRIGIGKPDDGTGLVEHVLTGFGKDEREIIGKALDDAAAAVIHIIRHGLDAAMNMYNANRSEC